MLDPVLLRTFLLIAEGASFSQAGRKLGLSQSSVSDHVRKLEKSVGHQLLIRDTHSIAVTPQGEAMIEFARIILETDNRARAISRTRRSAPDCVSGPRKIWWRPGCRKSCKVSPPRIR